MISSGTVPGGFAPWGEYFWINSHCRAGVWSKYFRSWVFCRYLRWRLAVTSGCNRSAWACCVSQSYFELIVRRSSPTRPALTHPSPSQPSIPPVYSKRSWNRKGCMLFECVCYLSKHRPDICFSRHKKQKQKALLVQIVNFKAQPWNLPFLTFA